MGRPRLARPAVVVQIKLHLRPDIDADLVAFFAAIPPYRRAGFVKHALRSGGPMPASSSGLADEDELTDLVQGLLFQ
jgi:hypothetical protein